MFVELFVFGEGCAHYMELGLLCEGVPGLAIDQFTIQWDCWFSFLHITFIVVVIVFTSSFPAWLLLLLLHE